MKPGILFPDLRSIAKSQKWGFQQTNVSFSPDLVLRESIRQFGAVLWEFSFMNLIWNINCNLPETIFVLSGTDTKLTKFYLIVCQSQNLESVAWGCLSCFQTLDFTWGRIKMQSSLHSYYALSGVQDMLPQDVALWHCKYLNWRSLRKQ